MTTKKQMRDAIDLAVWIAERTQAARDEEWNAALDAAAKMIETAPASYNRNDHADRVRGLRRTT